MLGILHGFGNERNSRNGWQIQAYSVDLDNVCHFLNTNNWVTHGGSTPDSLVEPSDDSPSVDGPRPLGAQCPWQCGERRVPCVFPTENDDPRVDAGAAHPAVVNGLPTDSRLRVLLGTP